MRATFIRERLARLEQITADRSGSPRAFTIDLVGVDQDHNPLASARLTYGPDGVATELLDADDQVVCEDRWHQLLSGKGHSRYQAEQ